MNQRTFIATQAKWTAKNLRLWRYFRPNKCRNYKQFLLWRL